MASSRECMGKQKRITLTASQAVQLEPYISRVRATAALGNPGMLLAQIHWNNGDGRFWMTPAFLPHETAQLITEKGEIA